MEFSSISQGIFIRKPKASSVAKDDSLAVKYYEGFSPPVSTVQIRSDLYRKQVSELKKIVESLINSWTKEMTARVLKYVQSSSKSLAKFQGEITPMAFIMTGVPGEDSKSLIQPVFMKLKEISPHFAYISSKMCLNAKDSFQYLCKQILGDNNHFPDYMGSGSSTEEDFLPASPEQSQSKRNAKHVNASDLKCWYERTQRPPIVICIEDIDFFPVTNVQNIITAFSCIKVPIIFVAGISSCCQTYDSFVPRTCPTTFMYKTFKPVSPEKRLEDFMHQILRIQDSPFQLSGEVVEYMSTLFLNEEFSVARLEQTVRLCLLEHYRLSESVLCAEYEYLQKNVLKPEVLSDEVIKATFSAATIKMAPRMKLNACNENWSITSFISSPKKTARQAATHVKDFDEHIVDFRKKQLEWRIYQEFLFALVNNLPGIPLEFKSVYTLYAICSSGALFEPVPGETSKESPLDKALGILKLLARPQLEYQMTEGLKSLHQLLEDLQDTHINQTRIPWLSDRVEHLLNKLTKVDEEEKKLQEAAEKDNHRKPKKYKSQIDFLEDMKKKALQTGGQAYFKLRDLIISELTRESKAFLKPLRDHPYARAFIFDDVDFLREMVTPNTHKRIHAALVEPENFLKCRLCSSAKDDCHCKSDIAILYGLILEQQMKNVNLNVLFEGFKSQVDFNLFSNVSGPKKRKSDSKNKQDVEILIRFRQAVAELQHLGFIKHSTSRVHHDEVARLHFGF